MKLTELTEMTMRSGSNMDTMPFPDFSIQPNLNFEGKMQHGYEVYSFVWKHTTIYGVKIDNEFASFVQVYLQDLPGVGRVAETLNSKTKKQYTGQLLSYKLKYFLNKHLGMSILLGNIHSIATETILPKITHLFDLNIINIKTGEIVPWNIENYKELSSIVTPTDWQVLLRGNIKYPFKEQVNYYVDWSNEKNRHMWTYGNYFSEFNNNELLEEYI